MGSLLDRLKVIPFLRPKNALLFDALRKAQEEREATRVACEAIAEAVETPAADAEGGTPLPEGK